MTNKLVYDHMVKMQMEQLKNWIDFGVENMGMQVVISIMGGYMTGLLRTFPPEEQSSCLATIITGLRMTPEQRAAYVAEIEQHQADSEDEEGILH
jgi:hypothetical protein